MFNFKKLIDLLYPATCASCNNALQNTNAPICLNCILNLPVIINNTTQHIKIMQKFDGKVNIHDAKSYLLFEKGNVAQKLVHNLKYRNNKEIGIWLGKKFGEELVNEENVDQMDLIIPIPLHPAKLKQRGYNQAEMIAEGLSEILKIPILADGLIKTQNNTSQTKKDRFDRYLNTTNLFMINSQRDIKNKHILLIDDVLTTGATLEAAAQVLIDIGCKVYIRTIASAN